MSCTSWDFVKSCTKCCTSWYGCVGQVLTSTYNDQVSIDIKRIFSTGQHAIFVILTVKKLNYGQHTS